MEFYQFDVDFCATRRWEMFNNNKVWLLRNLLPQNSTLFDQAKTFSLSVELAPIRPSCCVSLGLWVCSGIWPNKPVCRIFMHAMATQGKIAIFLFSFGLPWNLCQLAWWHHTCFRGGGGVNGERRDRHWHANFYPQLLATFTSLSQYRKVFCFDSVLSRVGGGEICFGFQLGVNCL